MFSSLNLLSACHWTWLDNDDTVKTVFRNHFGVFEYMVHFGLPHTPSVFMTVMNDVLQSTAIRTYQASYHSIGQKNVMQSFDALRSALVDAPALTIPDFNMHFAVKSRCIRCCIECNTQSAS